MLMGWLYNLFDTGANKLLSLKVKMALSKKLSKYTGTMERSSLRTHIVQIVIPYQ